MNQQNGYGVGQGLIIDSNYKSKHWVPCELLTYLY